MFTIIYAMLFSFQGPKLLVLNAVHEKIEKDPKWAGRLAQCR